MTEKKVVFSQILVVDDIFYIQENKAGDEISVQPFNVLLLFKHSTENGETLKDANSIINIGGTMTRTGGDVDAAAAAGGGFNIPTATGTHSVIVMNSTANIPDYRDNTTGNLVPGMTSGRGELLAHELLGHGLTRFNAGGNQFLNAIQLTNLYHRATGTGNLYRDGTSHGGTTGVPLTYPQASAVPLYLQ